MNLLVCNAGSSSLRLALFGPSLECLLTARAERLATPQAQLLIGKDPPHRQAGLDAPTAFELFCGVAEERGHTITCTAHRMVHGGTRFVAPTEIDSANRSDFSDLSPLAPLHMPRALAVVDRACTRLPGARVYALFDTAIYHDLPLPAQEVGLPKDWTDRMGWRRFGFHGFSHAGVSAAAARNLQRPLEALRVITCHLGNGCSATAWKDGRPVESTMGYSPLEGMMMGTRSGDLDPNLVLDLVDAHDGDTAAVRTMLNRRSGLLGRSGLSDFRDIAAGARVGEGAAVAAIALFEHRVQRAVGSLLPCLGGLDLLVFTGGIGEHDAAVRHAVCRGFECLGLSLDHPANAANETVISCPRSSVSVQVLPADEERTLAETLLRAHPDLAS